MSGWNPVPSTTPYADLINQSALQYGVPPQVLAWQLNQESGFNPNAYTQAPGGTPAEGIAQIQPATAADPGYGIAPVTNPYDPAQAIPFAAQYDEALYNNTGSWTGALTSYGTLQGVPPSVTNSFNQTLTANNIPNSGDPLGGYNPDTDPEVVDADPGAAYTTGWGVTAPGTSSTSPYGSAPSTGIYDTPPDGGSYDPLFPPGSPGMQGGDSPDIGGDFGDDSGSSGSGSGIGALIGEVALRAMLVIVGAVLILGGFLAAGRGRGTVIEEIPGARQAEELEAA